MIPLFLGARVRGRPRFQELPQSPKKQKLSLKKLKAVASGPRHVCIGELLTLPEVRQDTVVKSDTSKVLGSSSVVIKCAVTDNRVGPLPQTGKGKEGIRFLSIGDFSSSMSLGVDSTEAGIVQYDLPEKECGENARLFSVLRYQGLCLGYLQREDPKVQHSFSTTASLRKLNS